MKLKKEKNVQSKADALKKAEWVLRVALFGEFLGHGIFSLQLKSSFVELLTGSLSVSTSIAEKMLIGIGTFDIIVALLAIIYPMRIVLMWATFWGFATALVRPITGDPIWDFVERWANWGVPLALLFIRKLPKKPRDFFT